MIVYGREEPVDVLVVGAHPDDVEIFMGGTIALLASRGRRVGLVDLTVGEKGSRGTPEQRLKESRAAAEVLGAAFRVNLEQPDGDIATTREARRAMIRLIRTVKPALVFSHNTRDPHPDHAASHHLVKAGCHNAGLGKMEPDLPPHRPKYFFSFSQPHRVVPSFLVDIGAHWETKMAAIRCHQSQVAPHQPGEPQTYLGQHSFLQILEAHFRSFGAMVGAQFAEAFCSDSLLLVEDPLAAFGQKQGRLL
jgi:bacillithiol biosynthesis deacetylase BshB1